MTKLEDRVYLCINFPKISVNPTNTSIRSYELNISWLTVPLYINLTNIFVLRYVYIRSHYICRWCYVSVSENLKKKNEYAITQKEKFPLQNKQGLIFKSLCDCYCSTRFVKYIYFPISRKSILIRLIPFITHYRSQRYLLVPYFICDI